ncbi:Beta-glucanase precursor [Pseudobythopirellula maris]|uniref:Beta-glucanase n=1 Tax=Pseudobythopirellula maris TaxID=2527991 RepID=A0A5C5ZFP5_9BACT|nr:family 16 glycosylhydrolase [Pseudobythopirellula maris]TWT86204.1 Beta-glucanase precursor [Pseudobythopirellula maris]
MKSVLTHGGAHRRPRLFPALVALAAAACAFAPGRVAADAPEWSLAWEDGFESFDSGRWNAATSYRPTNNSLHAYLPSQVSVDAGELVIISENEPAGSLLYRSGLIESRSAQRYGRWEVRAKLPVSTGMWPAIWLLPDTSAHPWPSGGEIDIMENRGNQPTRTSSAFHYGTNPPYFHDYVYSEQQTATISGQTTRYDQGFHTYAVDWTPSYLRFYVDGVNHYTVHDEDIGGFLSGSTQPMRLVINTAVGGDFLPNPNASTVWPQEFRVDSVRVFEATGAPGVVDFTNGGFEANGDFETEGGLSGWSVFGNDLPGNPNVRVADEAVRSGTASLKVFGSYREGLNHSGVAQGVTVQPGDEILAELHALVRSADALAGANRVAMKIDFYSEYGAKHGGDAMLSEHTQWFADAATPTDLWSKHAMQVVAPDGAEEARLSIVFEQPAYDGGAIHVDNLLFGKRLAEPLGDYNSDGKVDAADFTVWRDSRGATGAGLAADGNGDNRVDDADYDLWVSTFGQSKNETPATVNAPEPSALGCALTLLAAIGGRSPGRPSR